MHRKNREEAEARNDPTGMVKARIAQAAAQEEEAEKTIAACTAKIKQLLEFGYNRSEISQWLNLHPYTADTIISRIEREERERDRIFLDWKRKSGGYVSYMSGVPTPR